MTGQPDFIVDPSGDVKDVRHQKYWRRSGSPPPQKPEAGSSGHGRGVPTHSQYIQKPKRPPGVIVIPIGLIIAIMVAVCRLLSGSTANDNYSDSDISFLNSGIGHYSRGEHDMAIIYFNMAISSEPDFGEAYNNRGLAYHAKGDNDRALADFEKAIQLLPDSAIPYSNRGAVYLSMGDHENAIADLDKALELDPRFSKAYYNRGLTYLGLGEYDNAIADFDKAIEFTPEEVSAILNKVPTGESRLSMGAVDWFKNTQSFADLSLAYANRGIAYFGKGDRDRAVADLEKALELGLDASVEQQVRALLTTRAFAPKPGHWKGEFSGGVYPAPISFDIGTDGNIHDLKFAMNFGSDGCIVTSDKIVVEADGTFSFAFGTSSSQDINVIQGRFESNTTVVGSTSNPLCQYK
jgi:tetratricopeptide (TPR) repeat protein